MSVERKSVPLLEQETTIGLDPVNRDQASVYSSVPAMINSLYKYKKKYPDLVVIEKDDGYGVQALVPASWVSCKPRKKRVLSDEQKARAAENLRKAREAKENDA